MMRVLSFSQPWLWAITDPIACKLIENRSWMPPIEAIGERFALHAAKSWDEDAISFFLKLGIDHFPARRALYPVSVITGVAAIDRIVTEARTLPPAQARWYMGPIRDGRTVYGWVLDDVRTLPTPIPRKGGQGLRYLEPATEAEINRQLGIAA